MLLHYKNPHNLFQTISNDLAESVKTPPDLSFMCDGGMMVYTHKTLLTTFSPFLRSILASLAPVQSSSSTVISLPDVSCSALYQVLKMLSKPWTEEVLSLNLDQIKIVGILGIPVGETKEIECNIEVEKAVKEDTRPILNKDIIRRSSSEALCESDGKGSSTPEKCLNSSLTEEIFDPEPVDDIVSKEPKCSHCDTTFRDTTPESIEEITIHLGEFHFETDLQVEQIKLFPIGKTKCEECGTEVIGDYVQKEHTMLEHPWALLKATTEGIVANAMQGVTGPVTDNFETTVEEATQSLLNKEFDIIESRTHRPQPVMEIETLQKIEDFIKNLSSNKSQVSSEEAETSRASSLCSQNSERSISLEASNVETEIKRPLTLNLSKANSSLKTARSVVVCTMCPQKWTYNSESRMSDLKSRIRSHLIDVHFVSELTSLLKSKFKKNVCQICDKTIITSDLQKKHIKIVHKLLEKQVLPILVSVLGKDIDRKDPSKKDKRRGSPLSESNHTKLVRTESYGSPVIENTSVIHDFLQESTLNDAKNLNNLEESSDFRDIQSNIEFSDSDDEDKVDKIDNFNAIQQNLEYSDSEDED